MPSLASRRQTRVGKMMKMLKGDEKNMQKVMSQMQKGQVRFK